VLGIMVWGRIASCWQKKDRLMLLTLLAFDAARLRESARPVLRKIALLLSVAAPVLMSLLIAAPAVRAEPRPNVVLILADDLGYGDLQCYGHPRFKTPRIDKMAEEGARLTDFQSCCPYCAPSRVGIQTGRYQFRSGLVDNPSPDPGHDDLGIPDSELTLGEMFKQAGYRTCCIGKWHLGHKPQFFPQRHGYDEYFGILYSNDMVPVQLYRDSDLYQSLVFQPNLTRRYTERAVKFIEENKERPFFLYLAHAMPHKPLAASTDFYGRSGGGLYGDVMAELDWSVGQVLDRLEELELDEQTLVLFTSDNGPWYGGSTGGLRGMKGQTWEGGVRVPLVARWPEKIPAGHVSHEPAVNIDLFTTCLKAAGIEPPTDRVIDGQDIMPLLTSKAKSPHEAIFTIRGYDLCAVRSGNWKLHGPASGPREYQVMQKGDFWKDPRAPDGIRILAPREQYPPWDFPGVATGTADKGWRLFDLSKDPSEQTNLSTDNRTKENELREHFERLQGQMPPDPNAEKKKAKAAKEKAAADKKAKDKEGDKPDDEGKPKDEAGAKKEKGE
jgi:uncharacterized sulfatase